MLVFGTMSKGSPGGIIVAHSPPWGDSTALSCVPWGKDIKSFLHCIWWLPKKKKKLHKTFLQSFFFSVAFVSVSL